MNEDHSYQPVISSNLPTSAFQLHVLFLWCLQRLLLKRISFVVVFVLELALEQLQLMGFGLGFEKEKKLEKIQT